MRSFLKRARQEEGVEKKWAGVPLILHFTQISFGDLQWAQANNEPQETFQFFPFLKKGKKKLPGNSCGKLILLRASRHLLKKTSSLLTAAAVWKWAKRRATRAKSQVVGREKRVDWSTWEVIAKLFPVLRIDFEPARLTIRFARVKANEGPRR